MGALIVELLPIVVAAAIVPGLLVLVILLLQGKHGGTGGLMFVAGVIVMRLVQGALYSTLMNAEVTSRDESGGAVKAILLIVLALLFLVMGIRLWLKGEDPDAPPPSWMEDLGQMSPARTFLAGMGAMAISVKQWVFTLAAVQAIAYSELTSGVSTTLFVLFVLFATLPLLVPVIVALVRPAEAKNLLQKWRNWLDDHYHAVTIAVSVGFGLLFLWKGLGQLLGA